MGYELAYFVGEIQEEFVCSICTMVLENPQETPCEHVFCDECIKGWIAVEESCPVDRKILRLTDLKPTPRYYRNLLNKLEVRCEMESVGCQTIVPLENLQSHLSSCMYKSEGLVVCDKGCDITMTRLAYEKSCTTHLSNKLISQLEEMKKHIEKLDRKVRSQRETMVRLVNKSNFPPKLLLKKIRNMKISSDVPNIFEPMSTERFSWAYAQFSNLGPANSFFKIHILSIAEGEYIVLGLTQYNHSADELPGHRVGSAGYYNKGEIVVNHKAEIGLQKWKNGDIIGCGVAFQNSSLNADFEICEIYFSINSKIISKKKMKVPKDGFFPTIRMGSFTTSVPKIEYLAK